MAANILKGLFKGLSRKKPMSYEEAKKMARHESESVRHELAARNDIKPEILYYMADDSSSDVRRKIAANKITPRHADLLLARDKDELVRSDLAGKIAKLAPGLTNDEQDKARQMTYQVLETLARDQATRVRQVLSDVLKDMVNAPPEVIGRLARDVEIVVSGPVLEFSPVLSDDDLLEIITTKPINGALGAISRRSTVNDTIVDAIVDTDEVEAIACLLANPSAQIREETLDDIINRATDIDSWHEPLVKRPKLPAGAATRLARFVADNLLEIMTERKDLDPEIAKKIKEVVHRRLENNAPSEEKDIWAETTAAASPLEAAKELAKSGNLNEAAIVQALNDGEYKLATAALAVLSGIKQDVVDKIIIAKSAKGIVAISWKAKISMKAADKLQRKLVLIAPNDVIGNPNQTGYPLSDEDMEWQLDFMKDL